MWGPGCVLRAKKDLSGKAGEVHAGSRLGLRVLVSELNFDLTAGYMFLSLGSLGEEDGNLSVLSLQLYYQYFLKCSSK